MNPYHISLLNDIHHWFPDILYRPERFETVTDLLQYIIHIASQHQSSYRQSSYRQSSYSQSNSYPNLSSFRPSTPVFSYSDDPHISRLFPQLSSILSILNMNQSVVSAETIPTIPTSEQIDHATTVHILEKEETNCAICLEQLMEGQEQRTINECHHGFHLDCLNRHFTTSPKCPMCRYDITSPLNT
jgi:hypothetical protein